MLITALRSAYSHRLLLMRMSTLSILGVAVSACSTLAPATITSETPDAPEIKPLSVALVLVDIHQQDWSHRHCRHRFAHRQTRR